MACLSPLKAVRDSSGVRIVGPYAFFSNLLLPCGKCEACRAEQSRQWAVRCMHEASLHDHNSFITLTYNDEHLPSDGSLNHTHFQRFFKRLRKKYGKGIRYYMAGEYGSKLGRPHYHAIVFGLDFSDKTVWKRTNAGSIIYRSASLEALWPFGYSSIGDVTFESAAYVARYVMKKVTGDLAEKHYRTVDLSTGEITQLKPEYNRMSNGSGSGKGGIGAQWYKQFASDVHNHDYVVTRDGKTCRPPRYYDKLLKRVDPDAYELIKDKREIELDKLASDNTPQRLIAKGVILKQNLNKLKRTLE